MKKIWMTAMVGLLAVSMAQAADVDGKKVFGAKCAMCHGLDAKGKPAMAKAKKVDPSAMDLTKASTQAKPDADLVKATSDGTGKMAAMKGKMTPAEIDAAVAYLKTLGAKKDAPKADDKK